MYYPKLAKSVLTNNLSVKVMMKHLKNGEGSMRHLGSVTSILQEVHQLWRLKELLCYGRGQLSFTTSVTKSCDPHL